MPLTIDKPARSFAKAVSWRLTGTVDTVVISYFVTGRLTLAVSIGAVELVTKTCLYYLHERVWNRVGFGRGTPDTDYDI